MGSEIKKYERECDACKRIPGNTGCLMHFISGKAVFRRGNPTRDVRWKCAKKALIDRSYEESGCSQLFPMDLRKLHSGLTTKCGELGLLCLSVWALIIVGCKLFLRPDELLNTSNSNFYSDLFVKKDGVVEQLHLYVIGKADKKKKYMLLHSDHECPELCPVRALLIYVYVAGIKSGNLFPTVAELRSPPTDGKFVTRESYKNFHTTFSKALDDYVPLPEPTPEKPADPIKIGLQMLRKTGYVLAIWGNGEWDFIKIDARHVSDEHAHKYAKDAKSTKHNATGDNKVGNGSTFIRRILEMLLD